MKHCETILICAVQLIHIMYLKCLVIAIVSLQGVLQYFTDVKYDCDCSHGSCVHTGILSG